MSEALDERLAGLVLSPMIAFVDISPIVDGIGGTADQWVREPRLINLAWISTLFPLRPHNGGKVARIDIGRNSLFIADDDHARVLAALGRAASGQMME